MQKIEAVIMEKIPSMALGVKKSLAKIAAGNVLLKLIQDGYPEVVALCLNNPHLVEAHLYRIINREETGPGNQRGVIEKWNGEEYWIEFLPKIWFIVIVDDKDVDAVIDAICDAATTGEPGDGKIFVSDVREAVRVRTRERGVSALTGGTPVHATADG